MNERGINKFDQVKDFLCPPIHSNYFQLLEVELGKTFVGILDVFGATFIKTFKHSFLNFDENNMTFV